MLDQMAATYVARLQRLGLPTAAAKAYVSLIELGESEAREIARAAGIPHAKVYAALDQLNEKGLVNVGLDVPRRYSPRPMGEYLAQLRKEEEARLREIETDARDLADFAVIRSERPDDDRGTFSMLRGRPSSIRRISGLIQRAEQDILILATAGFRTRAHMGAHLLAAARARGVRVRLLCQGPDRACDDIAAKLPGAEIRRAPPREDAPHVAMMIVDRATALIVHFMPDDDDLRRGHDVGVVTTEGAIVGSIGELIDRQWDASEPILPHGSRRFEIAHDATPRS